MFEPFQCYYFSFTGIIFHNKNYTLIIIYVIIICFLSLPFSVAPFPLKIILVQELVLF